MTPAQRETLDALASDENVLCTTTVDERAAIRAALAEVDRLNATADRLLADCEAVRAVASKALGKADAGGDEAHLVGLVVDRLHAAQRENDALRAELVDLRSRVANYRRLHGDGGEAADRLLDIKRTLDAALLKETPEESNG